MCNCKEEMEPESRLGFSEALSRLKRGFCVAREGWNGKGMFIYLAKEVLLPSHQTSDKEWVSGSTDFLVMRTADGGLIPWLASQTDVLACDWTVVNP